MSTPRCGIVRTGATSERWRRSRSRAHGDALGICRARHRLTDVGPASSAPRRNLFTLEAATSTPRLREGPFAGQHVGFDQVPVPPRLRGCSDGSGEQEVGQKVALAPAGMLRTGVTAPSRPDVSAPRPRGCSSLTQTQDQPGPLARACGAIVRRAARRVRSGSSPPRMRGWSGALAWFRRDRGVAPAPAGMVRGRSGCTWGRRSRPRARGDGPAVAARCEGCHQSPPRPRGWSLRTSWAAGQAEVAPAPAGMVR